MRGRPLAFLVLVVVGWGAGRFLALAPDDAASPLTLVSRQIIAPPAAADTVAAPLVPRFAVTFEPAVKRPSALSSAGASPSIRPTQAKTMISRAVASVSVPAKLAGSTALVLDSTASAPPGLPPIPVTESLSSRWAGSAWAIVRDGGGGSLLSPLLGGSQLGVRIAYRLDDENRVALFARAAAPLRNGPAELSAGAQWRPIRAPVTLYAEVRATRGELAPALGVFGGGGVALPAAFRLEGYGQAGVIRRNGINGFGDAQARVMRPLGPIEVGAGAWAAVQRGASRLDVGPSLTIPLANDPLALRVTLDWRHRIEGNARPASGPSLSLGADF